MRRRDVLRALALAALAPGCGSRDSSSSVVSGVVPVGPSPAPSASPGVAFLQPELRSSRNGVLETTLTTREASYQIAGMSVVTRTYEGGVGGPTLRLAPGERLRVNLVNRMPANPDAVPSDMNIPHHFNTTNLHTHGLHVSPAGNSDNIFVAVEPGESFQYDIQVPANHPSGTFFYHPHRHGAASMQMFGGMGGALLISGGLDEVPEVAAARDLVYLINELSIDPTRGMVPQFVAPPSAGIPFAFSFGDRILTVNGVTAPVLVARPGEVLRLRVINASPRTDIPFGVDEHELHVLAYDGITLGRVRTVAQVDLTPANRAEVLVRAGAPGVYAVRKRANTAQVVTDPEQILGYLQVTGSPVVMGLPGVLPAPLRDILATEITGRRTLTFDTGRGGPGGIFPNFPINGQRFDANRIDQTVTLGAVEEWSLQNPSTGAHPFHIHVNPFQVVAVNGTPLPVPEWRDTVNIPAAGSVTVRMRFEDFRGLFVLHCHTLVHEDLGMMQTVNVV